MLAQLHRVENHRKGRDPLISKWRKVNQYSFPPRLSPLPQDAKALVEQRTDQHFALRRGRARDFIFGKLDACTSLKERKALLHILPVPGKISVQKDFSGVIHRTDRAEVAQCYPTEGNDEPGHIAAGVRY